jgi:hypothetical protein
MAKRNERHLRKLRTEASAIAKDVTSTFDAGYQAGSTWFQTYERIPLPHEWIAFGPQSHVWCLGFHAGIADERKARQ